MIIQATYHDQPIISSACDRWFGMLSLELVITHLHVALKRVAINNLQQFLRQHEVALTGPVPEETEAASVAGAAVLVSRRLRDALRCDTT